MTLPHICFFDVIYYYMRYISILLVLFFSVAADAQTSIIHRLQLNEVGKGRVTIHQDESITALIGGHKRITTPSASSHANNTAERKPVRQKNESNDDDVYSSSVSGDVSLEGVVEEAPKRIVKVSGYRVQVYAGNNTRNAKLEAMRTASDVRNFFPEISVYSFFSPPRWLCRVGDFRSMEEAYSMMRKLKSTRVFHEVSIVKDRVNVSL
jgi:hypothetical protein